jgi:hypothetical protein
MVSLRIPLDALDKIQKLADEKETTRGRLMIETLVQLVNTKRTPPGPHKYPEALKSHAEGDMAVDEYGNAYILVGDKFEYKEPE